MRTLFLTSIIFTIFLLYSCDNKNDTTTLEKKNESTRTETQNEQAGNLDSLPDRERDSNTHLNKGMDTSRTSASDTSGSYVCVLNSAQGNNVKGTLRITKSGNNIKIQGEITGLTPGKHGFHIHEKGDCSAPDFTSAGDHFNPSKKEHGDMGSSSHAGDLGNINADSKGTAKINITLSNDWTMTGTNGIAGRSMIVHEKEDDLKTQPTGNSGARIACGVIEKAGS